MNTTLPMQSGLPNSASFSNNKIFGYAFIKKPLLFSLATILSVAFAFGQAPTVTGFTPASGPAGTSVTITGTHFNATAANNIVFFGATMATVTAAGTTSLTVTVPVGATYQPISVLNNASALAGYSATPFVTTFTPTKSSITTADIAAKVDFAGGATPYSVAIGDLDGDGKPDLAVVNQNGNTVSVFRNISSSGSITAASFAARVDFATGSYPVSVAIGDFDGDGKPDLAVANYLGSTVSVLRNTSTSGSITTTSFAAHVDFATGKNPFNVAIGDIDGDGKPDLATANQGGNTVSVLRNKSASGAITTASFAAKVDLATPNYPLSVAIGDLDGDGKSDLAVVTGYSGTVSVFRNISSSGSITTGSFAAHVDFATGSFPYSVAIGDLDGDGKPDLAVANYYDATVSVLRNTSTSGPFTAASFAAHVDFATGTEPNGVVIGDLDGDGKPDLVVVSNFNSIVSVLHNMSGSGSITATSFAARVDFATGNGPESVAIGDLDGDGKPDLAVVSYNDNTVSVLRNNPLFAPATQATALTFTATTATATTASWTNGSGASRAVFMLAGSSGTPAPADLTAYNANAAFGTGDQIGSTGWYCVYNGTGSTVNVTGLAPGTTYQAMVVEYSGTGSNVFYLTAPVAGNPAVVTTLPSFSYSSPQTYAVGAAIAPLTPSGSGVAVQAYNPTPVPVGPGFSGPVATAVDAAGNVYLLFEGSTSVTKIPAGNGTPVTIGSGFSSPEGVAVDAAGNVFVADLRNGAVKEIQAAGGATVIVASGFNSPYSIAVDAGGNIYVTENSIGVLKEIPAGSSTPVTLASGFSFPDGVAVDAAGNVYVADNGHNAVTEIPVGGGTPVSIGSGFSSPYGLAVDAGGNVYVADFGHNAIKEIPVGGAPITIGGPGFSEPTSVAVDAAGNVYATDFGNNALKKILPLGGYYTGPFLPAGLILNSNTGVISGTPTTLIAAANHTVTGYNSVGSSATAIVTIGVVTAPPAPATAATGLAFTATTATATTASWTNGNGASRAVFMAAATGGSPAPVNLTAYNANAAFGTGDQIGSTGWYCVYNGTGSTVNVTGLAPGTTYQAMVVEYNGTGTLEVYLTAAATGNPAGLTTLTPVTSITLVGTSPTNATTLDYTVTFLTALTTPPSIGDFTLTGGAAGTINSITTTDNINYDVTVTNVSGDGALELDMNSGSDAVPNISNLPFTGQAYTIDNTPPVVTVVELPYDGTYGIGGTLSFIVDFNEPVTVNTTGGIPYIGVTLNTGGTVQAYYQWGSTGTQLGFTYTVVAGNADPDGITIDNAITMNGGTLADFAGNIASSASLSGAGSTSGILVDAIQPVVNSINIVEASPTNATSLDYTVTFSKDVFGVSTDSFSLFSDNNAIGNLNSVTSVSGSVYTINVNNISGDGSLRLDLMSSGTGIFDLNSNEVVGGFNTGATYTIDNTPPTATISAPSVTQIGNNGSGTVTYTVTYADANFNTSNLTNAGIIISSPGTATGTVAVTGSGTSYTVTISNITGVGTLGISVGAGFASDLAGNTDAGAGPSTPFTVLSSDATLSSLSLSSGTLSPVFSSGITGYTAHIPYSVSGITVSATPDDPNATSVTTMINGNPASGSTLLNVGTNTVVVTVTARDGTTTDSYTVTINRAASVNANLARIVLAGGVPVPGFAPSTTAYTVTVTTDVTTETITPTVSDPNATVTLNGSPIASGATSGPFTLNIGNNTFTLVVTAQNQTTKTYTVIIDQVLSSDAYLSNLVISDKVALSPNFTFRNMAYTATVPASQGSVTVKPTSIDPNAVITVNNAIVASKTFSTPITLHTGSNTITILVTAQDGTPQTYTVTITRPLSNDAYLSNLVVNTTALSPAFAYNSFNYTASVPNETMSVTIKANVIQAGATFIINGHPAQPQIASDPIPLTVGTTAIPIVVTALDNSTTQTYTITITRAPGSVNTVYQPVGVAKPTATPVLAEDGIKVHQGISPNGDGIDDFLQIDNISQYPDNKLSIMNRNGQLVYEAKGYDNSSKLFDGHSNKNGQMQLPGTYFYQLDYTVAGITKHKTGFIVLKY